MPRVETILHFGDLIDSVGQLQAQNQAANYLFRGQDRLYPTDGQPFSVRPRFYRAGSRQLANLERLQSHISHVTANTILPQGYTSRPVAAEALLQHYERVDTRMLDCTHILHVAATFALFKDWRTCPEDAVILVIDINGATPDPAQGQWGAVLVAATAGPGARRPIRQAAWAVFMAGAETDVVDFADRLVAVYRIPRVAEDTFWRGFMPYEHGWMMARDGFSSHFCEV